MTSLTGSPRIPALVTGGRRKASPATSPSKADSEPGRPGLWRSLAVRVVLLFVVFAALPAFLYQELQNGDRASFYGLAVAYAIGLGLLLWVFVSLLLNLRRLSSAVLSLSADNNLRLGDTNSLAELDGVVREFDRMNASLRLAAETSRIAAIENAHAFKTPIATITHALTPLRNAVPADNVRARRSLELIQMTVTRLDALVMASRRMEEAFAKALHPHRDRIDLAAIVRHRVAKRAARPVGEGQAPSAPVQADIATDIVVDGNADLICTALDNIIDNAVSFTRPGSAVSVTVRRDGAQAQCCIDDEGPGARQADLERIFERYYTYRPVAPNPAEPSDFEEAANFGIGLWVARRNIEAMGGTIWAESRSTGGMRIVITLPLAGK